MSMTTRAVVSVVDVVTLVSPAAGASATVRVAGGSARTWATAGAVHRRPAPRSSASASMRTTTPSVSVAVVTPAGGAISKVTRAPRAHRLDSRRDARHAHHAEQQQARRTPVLDALIGDRAERARHEVHRRQPAAADARQRTGQRDHAPVHRHERAVTRRDDVAAANGHDEAALTILAHRQRQERRDVVERDVLLAVDQRHGQRRAFRPATRR